MPELPDVELYLAALRPRLTGTPIERVRVASPFFVRTFDPPMAAVEGHVVRLLADRALSRLLRQDLPVGHRGRLRGHCDAAAQEGNGGDVRRTGYQVRGKQPPWCGADALLDQQRLLEGPPVRVSAVRVVVGGWRQRASS